MSLNMSLNMSSSISFSPRVLRAIFQTLALLLPLFCIADAAAQGVSDNALLQLRRHTEGALARGDLRAAEMLIETYLPAAQRLSDPTWQLFNGHLIATRIKLGLNKLDEAAEHSKQLSAIVARSKRTDTMEHAIAAITSAQVLQKQGSTAASGEQARNAITALRRAHERGRITRRTFETELLAYEEVLIQATSGPPPAAP